MTRCWPLSLVFALGAVPVAQAQDVAWGYNTFGMPGLIDMPQALPAADADLAFTSSHLVDQTRHTLTFQISPRLSGSFRYSLLYGVSPGADGETVEFRFDRSFALQYLLAEEGRLTPALAVGLNDFLGTGQYSSEYLVATRSFGDRVRVSAGIGWGRLAGVGSFDNPLGVLGDEWDSRDRTSAPGIGGQVDTGQWFRGPAALFGGVEWRPSDRLLVVAEYSSDAYPIETPYVFDRRSQLNLGLRYALTDEWTLGAQYLYGSELGVQLTYAINPTRPPRGSGLDPAPVPVTPQAAVAAASWAQGDGALRQTRQRSNRALAAQGLVLHGLTITGTTATVEVENPTYMAAAQAVGRAARALSGTLPPAVTRIEVVLVVSGLPVSRTALNRADLQELEFTLDGAWAAFTRADRADPGPGTAPLDTLYPRFSWGIDPFIAPVLFDPDQPFRADVGVDLSARYEIAPGMILAGNIRQPLLGSLDEADRVSTSTLPHVRSDGYLYDRASPALSRLTAAWYFRPGTNLYGRVTLGLLEPMFGGVSAELLWYPHDSRLAFGAEVNHVVQRDYDQQFGFLDYDVTTGHLSAYWDIGQGYQAQVDVGRYLAGDWGATLGMERRFENGWRIGAFATLTDVPFEEFGEGSFDKGIRLTIPVGWINGQATRDLSSLTIRPVLRDGGARLDVDGRLYDMVRDANGAELADNWGRFWR